MGTSRLLVGLTIADFGQALFFMSSPAQLQDSPGSALCSIQAAAGIFMACSSFLWTLCIAWYVYWVAAAPGSAASVLVARSSVVLFSGILAWGYPALFLVALFVVHPHMVFDDPSAPWCFLSTEYPFWRLGSVYVLLVLCWVATSVLYLL